MKYKLLCEILSGKKHPNVDMLVVKPCLYTYIPKYAVPFVKEKGITCDDNSVVKCFFSRIPESIKHYNEFLKANVCCRVLVSKLEKIKDQKCQVKAINVTGYDKIGKKEIGEICEKNNTFYKLFEKGTSLDSMPRAEVWLENKILPSFCLKILE